MIRLIFLSFSLLALHVSGVFNSVNAQGWDTYSDTWVGEDELQRQFPTQQQVGEPRDDKQVGVFYHNWHEIRPAIHDITKILEANPDNPNYGPVPRFHYTTEPYLGYYLSTDRFVIRKHIQMFNDAMVDAIIIDMSNNSIHEEGLIPLLEELQYLHDSGQKTPGVVAFIGPRFDDPQPVHQMWEKYYSQNKYSDLWYRWDGKPLILAKKLESYTSQMKEFFTWRESWARTDTEWFGDGKDKWPWMTRYPQNYGWHIDPNTPEATSVSTAFRVNENIGRSYHNGVQPPYDKYYLPIDRSLTGKGLFFQDQWDMALEVDPRFIFLTGWNEFTAQHFELVEGGRTNAVNFLGKIYRLPEDSGTDYFVAIFNQEYSREVEPAKTGIKDNYYYQFVSNVRKYKGVRSIPVCSEVNSIAINSDFSQWAAIQYEYRDDIGDVTHRDSPNYDGKERYVNNTGRNDFIKSKVAYDSDNVYFYIETDDAITPHTNENWMWLLLNTDGDYSTGWHGYDYLINHSVHSSTATTIKSYAGEGFNWNNPVDIEYAYQDNQMHIKVPRDNLGIAGQAQFTIDFKWADFDLSQSSTNPETDIVFDMETGNGWDVNYSPGVGNLTLSDGILSYDVITNDPYITSNTNLGYAASDYPQIKIRVKNLTDGTVAAVFFKMDHHAAFAGNMVTTAISPNSNEFVEYTFEMQNHPNWNGTIKELRLDLPNNHVTISGRAEIDYIQLIYNGENNGAESENIEFSGDIISFIDLGDVAPNGRFNYRFMADTTDVGISEHANEKSLTIYPNPAKNFVTISGNALLNVPITITDLQGRIAYELEKSSSPIVTIEISNFTKGIYLVKAGAVVERLMVVP